MNAVYAILLVIAILLAIVFTVLVLITSKGDAMSGQSSGVRTSFKGKDSFDDRMSRIVFYMGGVLLALVLILDKVSNILH